MAVSAVGLVMGGLAVQFYRSLPSRQPSSSFPAPKLRLKPWSESLVSKAHQAIEVKVFAVDGVPDHEEQELRLRAEVTLRRPIDQEVKFEWSLPPDASLVSGEISDAWPNLKPGQTATTEIVILGVSKESVTKTVTLHVSGLSNGVQYASSGSFATNSPEQMAQADSMSVMKLQNSELVLKKNDSAAKMEKVHQ